MSNQEQQQQRHVPYNSESELDAYEAAPAAGPRGSTGPSYVQQNSESESEFDGSHRQQQQQQQPPSVAFNDSAADDGRGRRGAGGATAAGGVTGFAAQTGTYAEPNSGDDDDTLPPLVDPSSLRARSRTPRGNRSKSRSRSRARAEGGLRTEVLMNEDSDSGLEGESGAGSDDAATAAADQERVGRMPASYVPQNEGSDTDGDGNTPSTTGRKHVNTSGPGQTARSRSRSQNRQVRYQAPMNSESESDEVVTEYTTGPPSKDFYRADRIDVLMNSESERE